MLRKLRVTLLVPVIAILITLTGCDKKASISTVGLMDSAAKQSNAIATSYGTQSKFVFTGTAEDVANLQGAFDDVKGTLDQLALGFSRGNEALQAKRVLSEEAANQVANTPATITAVIKVTKRLNALMQPKTPEDGVALGLWKAQVVSDLEVLVVTVSKLDLSIKADMAASKK